MGVLIQNSVTSTTVYSVKVMFFFLKKGPRDRGHHRECRRECRRVNSEH